MGTKSGNGGRPPHRGRRGEQIAGDRKQQPDARRICSQEPDDRRRSTEAFEPGSAAAGTRRDRKPDWSTRNAFRMQRTLATGSFQVEPARGCRQGADLEVVRQGINNEPWIGA